MKSVSRLKPPCKPMSGLNLPAPADRFNALSGVSISISCASNSGGGASTSSGLSGSSSSNLASISVSGILKSAIFTALSRSKSISPISINALINTKSAKAMSKPSSILPPKRFTCIIAIPLLRIGR